MCIMGYKNDLPNIFDIGLEVMLDILKVIFFFKESKIKFKEFNITS